MDRKLLLDSVRHLLEHNGVSPDTLTALTWVQYDHQDDKLVVDLLADPTPVSSSEYVAVFLEKWMAFSRTPDRAQTLTLPAAPGAGDSAAGLQYQCLNFMNAPIFGMLTTAPVSLSATCREEISMLLLPFLWHTLRVDLQKGCNGAVSAKDFGGLFSAVAAQRALINCAQHPQPLFERDLRDMFNGSLFSVESNQSGRVDFHFPLTATDASPLQTYIWHLMSDFLRQEYQYWETVCRYRPFAQTGIQVGVLQNQLQQSRSTYKELIEAHKQLETQLRILNSEKSFTAENEFYKGAVTWHIRFQGNIVHLNRKNIKGLAYIHKLLSHPNVEFYPNQLESDLPSKREDSKNITLFETFQSVDLNIRPYKSIVDDEEELLKALKRLTNDRPVDMDPESTPDLEGLIYHLAEELYVINALKNITSKKAYIHLYNDNKEKFDTACFLLRRQNSNPFLTNTIIQKAKTIRTPHQGSSPSHKVKDRVGKAIRNSIDAMDSVPFQEYLAQTLSLGERCVFTPQADHPVDWQLFVS